MPPKRQLISTKTHGVTSQMQPSLHAYTPILLRNKRSLLICVSFKPLFTENAHLTWGFHWIKLVHYSETSDQVRNSGSVKETQFANWSEGVCWGWGWGGVIEQHKLLLGRTYRKHGCVCVCVLPFPWGAARDVLSKLSTLTA